MSPTGDESRGGRRRDVAPDGEVWDDGAWVDVGGDNRWRPSFEERSRSFIVLVILLGVFLLMAAVASVGSDGDGDPAEVVANSTSTSTTEPTSTTTEVPGPSSIDGEPASPECAFDDRDASPLRDRSESTVLVLNGSTKSGHAGDNTDDLEALGYTSMTPGNATIRAGTGVEYVTGYCAEAIRLITDLDIPGVTVNALDPTDDDVFLGRAVLVVTLGRDSV